MKRILKNLSHSAVFSIIDVCSIDSESNVSVLRTFRLLRIVKLLRYVGFKKSSNNDTILRFCKTLRHQLAVMISTLDEVGVFMGVMVIFLFMFR